MSYRAEVFKVMISSPCDVKAERNIVREVLSEWNAVNSEMRKIVLLPVGWETHSWPEMGDRPQAIINKQLKLKDCDILIGVFWTRIGTETGLYSSGSVEEIEEHIAAKKTAMLYFSSAPINPNSIDPKQHSELERFKKSCESRGLCERYSDISEFRLNLSRHLQIKLNLNSFIRNDDMNRKKYINIIKSEIETCIYMLEQEWPKLLPVDAWNSAVNSDALISLENDDELRPLSKVYQDIKEFNFIMTSQGFIVYPWKRLEYEDGTRLPKITVNRFLKSRELLLEELRVLKNEKWLNLPI